MGSEMCIRDSRYIDEKQIISLIEDGMLERLSDDIVRVSREGWFVLDAVVADLAM